MTFFESIQSHIIALDKKSYYRYLAIIGAFFLLTIGAIIFFYFSSLAKWEEKINLINEERIEAKRLLGKAEKVQRERAEVTALLAQDPNFKIKAYIQEILARMGLLSHVTAEKDVVVTGRDDHYSETTATYQLSGISMKQLTEFLNEIDENKRVFTKELDISKSKKIPRAIDIDIKIATMISKEVI